MGEGVEFENKDVCANGSIIYFQSLQGLRGYLIAAIQLHRTHTLCMKKIDGLMADNVIILKCRERKSLFSIQAEIK